MPRWLKVVLIIFGCFAVLCLASAGAGYVWFNQNKEKLKGVGDRAKKEGAEFGYRTDSNGCIDEALRRLEGHRGIVEQAENKIFFKTCLEKATRPPQFCDGVPPRSELMKSAAWCVEQCVARGKPEDQDCARLFQGVLEACDPRPAPIPAG